MPPIRRYLRITRYSVLEVRIHLEDPAQVSWLLRGADPALGRIFTAIRPLVLPKLREEHERARGKVSAKKRGVKDTLTQDDYEVSVFLTESLTRHQLLTKAKSFTTSKARGNLKDWLQPIGSARGTATADESTTETIEIREESPEDNVILADIPSDPLAENATEGNDGSRSVRGADEDGKKLAPQTSYDGFSIYGRTLCLVVKRRSAASSSSTSKSASAQQMMESWVSTQAAQGNIDDVGDNG